MVVRVLLVLLGAFYAITGVWMLAAPESWYAAVPGVPQTGPLNHHFIQDVGMAFIASGGFLALGARSGVRAATFAIAGATWPLLHALIHIAGWFMHGIPTSPARLASDAVGVVGLSALAGLLAWLRAKGENP